MHDLQAEESTVHWSETGGLYRTTCHLGKPKDDRRPWIAVTQSLIYTAIREGRHVQED